MSRPLSLRSSRRKARTNAYPGCQKFMPANPAMMGRLQLAAYKDYLKASLSEGSASGQVCRSHRWRCSSPSRSDRTTQVDSTGFGGSMRHHRDKVDTGHYSGQPCMKATSSTFGNTGSFSTSKYSRTLEKHSLRTSRSVRSQAQELKGLDPRPCDTNHKSQTHRVMTLGSEAVTFPVSSQSDAFKTGLGSFRPSVEAWKEAHTARRHHPGEIQQEQAFCNYLHHALYDKLELKSSGHTHFGEGGPRVEAPRG